MAVKEGTNTKTAVAAPKGQTVKVAVYLCTNGVPAVPHVPVRGHVAVRAGKARSVKSGHQKHLNHMGLTSCRAARQGGRAARPEPPTIRAY